MKAMKHSTKISMLVNCHIASCLAHTAMLSIARIDQTACKWKKLEHNPPKQSYEQLKARHHVGKCIRFHFLSGLHPKCC